MKEKEQVRHEKFKNWKEKTFLKKEDRPKITFCHILAYFFVYSIAGFIVETIFGVVTKGVLESRQSFLYGPFCGIYGVGAVVMILCLSPLKQKRVTLFWGGFIIGSIVEYVLSLLGEIMFNIKWWDYSDMAFNINGRICIAYSFFWGILGVFLMLHLNPRVDKWMNKIPQNIFRGVAIAGVTFMLIDAVVTGFALKIFFSRLVTNYQVNVDESLYITEDKAFYHTDLVKYLSENVFTDQKILKTFPNIKFIDKEGKMIWVRDLLPDIKPYYLELSVPKIHSTLEQESN